MLEKLTKWFVTGKDIFGGKDIEWSDFNKTQRGALKAATVMLPAGILCGAVGTCLPLSGIDTTPLLLSALPILAASVIIQILIAFKRWRTINGSEVG